MYCFPDGCPGQDLLEAPSLVRSVKNIHIHPVLTRSPQEARSSYITVYKPVILIDVFITVAHLQYVCERVPLRKIDDDGPNALEYPQ